MIYFFREPKWAPPSAINTNIATPLREGISEVKEEEVEESPNTGNIYESDDKEEENKEKENKIDKEDSQPKIQDEGNPDPKQKDNTEEIEGEGEGDGQSEQIPLLFVDVNLGEGTTDRIVLYDGDDPAEVAKDFSTRHSLDASMTGKLTDLLTQQMNGVLTKIVEEGDDGEGDTET